MVFEHFDSPLLLPWPRRKSCFTRPWSKWQAGTLGFCIRRAQRNKLDGVTMTNAAEHLRTGRCLLEASSPDMRPVAVWFWLRYTCAFSIKPEVPNTTEVDWKHGTKMDQAHLHYADFEWLWHSLRYWCGIVGVVGVCWWVFRCSFCSTPFPWSVL